MSTVFFRQRVKDLEDHVAKAQAMLGEYEENRDLSDDPRTRARCGKAIEELRASVKQYSEELEELQRQLTCQENGSADDANEQLASIEDDLKVLMGGQIAILGRLEQTKKALLSHYDNTASCIVTRVIDRLSQNQLQLTQELLDGLEVNKVSEIDIEEALVLVEQRLPNLADTSSIPMELTRVIENPNLDARHRLKVCIPIIPLLLDYEGEIELGTGFDFKILWDRVKTRLRGCAL